VCFRFLQKKLHSLRKRCIRKLPRTRHKQRQTAQSRRAQVVVSRFERLSKNRQCGFVRKSAQTQKRLFSHILARVFEHSQRR